MSAIRLHRSILVAIIGCGTSGNVAQKAPEMTRGFEIHAVKLFGTEPTTAGGPAWERFLSDAPLGEVFVADADIEAVALQPFTLVLAQPAGEALVRTWGPSPQARFIATLDGVRKFAGRIMFVGTARAILHPVIHVDNTGFAIAVQILPALGAHADSEVTTPPAVIEHFRASGRLLAPGAPVVPPARHRRWMAEATSTKPGEPSSRIDAECTGTTCRLRVAFRKPGTAEGTWDQEEELALDLADFDAVWSLIERSHLAQLEPRPTTAPSPVHPGKWRWRFELERMTGERVEIDRSWESPSSADTVGASFLVAAGKLAQHLAQTVPVRYFPAP